MTARPRPFIGFLLGTLLGLIVMCLLWLTGILPPDRLPLFGILAVTIAGVSALCIQRVSSAKGASIAVAVIAALSAGVALTGIAEEVNGGSLSQGCTFEVTTSGGETTTPGNTFAALPLDAVPGETLTWQGTTGDVPMGDSASAGLVIGGWTIVLWNGTDINTDDAVEWGGTLAVDDLLTEFQDASGLELTGTFHVSGSIASGASECTGQGYVRVSPDGAFSTTLLIALWIALAIVIIAIIVVAVLVRRSFTAAARVEGAPVGSTSGLAGSEPDSVSRATVPDNRHDGDAEQGTDVPETSTSARDTSTAHGHAAGPEAPAGETAGSPDADAHPVPAEQQEPAQDSEGSREMSDVESSHDGPDSGESRSGDDDEGRQQ
ncbi:hypothetical protein [Demequina flava]|uniref:hypothetical protein n=1 Tax=Demequina flava TaxID=1095025 RepID=UPI0007810459|nr:hypothetical protein [Demequina flava]